MNGTHAAQRPALTNSSSTRKRSERSDVARNKAAILAATGELLLRDPEQATMQTIAEEAGLHVATVYRYFPSIEELHREYLLHVQEQLVTYAESLSLEGVSLFEAVLGKWIHFVGLYGPAMVRIRSREGYLARLRSGDAHAQHLEMAWGTAIKELMQIEGVADSHYEYALALRNSMFNSREILDLLEVSERSPSRLVQDLTTVYRAALRGLSETALP